MPLRCSLSSGLVPGYSVPCFRSTSKAASERMACHSASVLVTSKVSAARAGFAPPMRNAAPVPMMRAAAAAPLQRKSRRFMAFPPDVLLQTMAPPENQKPVTVARHPASTQPWRCGAALDGNTDRGRETVRPARTYLTSPAARALLHLRQKNLVDDVDDAVRLAYIGDRDMGDLAGLVGHRHLTLFRLQRQRAAADRLDLMRAAIGLGHLGDVGGHGLCGDDVAGENPGQAILVLGLEQRLDRAGRQRRERLVGRGKDG